MAIDALARERSERTERLRATQAQQVNAPYDEQYFLILISLRFNLNFLRFKIEIKNECKNTYSKLGVARQNKRQNTINIAIEL